MEREVFKEAPCSHNLCSHFGSFWPSSCFGGFHTCSGSGCHDHLIHLISRSQHRLEGRTVDGAFHVRLIMFHVPIHVPSTTRLCMCLREVLLFGHSKDSQKPRRFQRFKAEAPSRILRFEECLHGEVSMIKA